MPELIQYHEELQSLKEDIELKIARLAKIESDISEQEKNLKIVSEVVTQKLGEIMEKDKFLQFFKKPYVVWSQGKNKVLVFIPKFVKGFQVGWLVKEDENFYIYQLDQYSAWLGDVPQELLQEINFKKEIEGFVEGDTIHFEPSMKDVIRSKLREHLSDISENQARITRGHIFDVIAEMVENGCLPFKARKVSEDDLREAKSKIELRSYQKIAVKKFMETGATGVFHPTGAGKSLIALHLMDVIKGKKLVIVPTRTLAEQWNIYIETYIPHCKGEIKISTYQGFRDTEEDFVLTIYDECQRLPADTFSRLSVIRTKYRMGLSASPHREDGRESYIFALTGFPVGLNWQEYMETVGKSYHPVYVHIVANNRKAKLKKCYQLVDEKMQRKTLIFSDSIDLGKEIANYFSPPLPFVYGESSNRMEVISNSRVCVVSRVADLGISIKDLQHIIEVDFLFGSRQQELQRTGRLMHSEAKGAKHDIIMTQKEFSQYGKRLWALREKGFDIKVVES